VRFVAPEEALGDVVHALQDDARLRQDDRVPAAVSDLLK
jgi:hypothetical protein